MRLTHTRRVFTTAALAASAGLATAQEIGPSTAVEPYVVPTAAGVRTVSLLAVGDSVGGPGAGDYALVGIPDGMGGYRNPNGTISLLCNHELGAGAGVVRRHGGAGAFVSQWIIDPDTLEVLRGRDLINQVRLWDKAAGKFIPAKAEHFDRFCSADMPAPGAFYNPVTGLGTTSRIYTNGEETRPPGSSDHGRGFAHVLTGQGGAFTWELPWLGRMAFENVVASPFPQDLTIVAGLDDADRVTDPTRTVAPSELYFYVGVKQAEGTEIDKAGLTGGDLHGLRVVVDGAVVTEESAEFGLGEAAYVGEGRFELHGFGDVGDIDGNELQSRSIDNDVTRFIRVEDGAWDTRPGFENTFYFVTTGNIGSLPSRLWEIIFDDIADPAAGGTIRILLRGDEGHEMLDNICMDRAGNIIMQEDVGNNPRLGKIWQYNVAGGELKEIAAHNERFFAPAAPELLTTDEESSGVFDATDLLGSGWFFINVQAHAPHPDPALVQHGQILAMFNPDSVVERGDFNGDGEATPEDLAAFTAFFRRAHPAADLDFDGRHTVLDFAAFLSGNPGN